MNEIPDDLHIIRKIPDEHVADGRHSMAECEDEGCRNPVRYCMTVMDYPRGYDTVYWCEDHKPVVDSPAKPA